MPNFFIIDQNVLCKQKIINILQNRIKDSIIIRNRVKNKDFDE